MKIYYFISDVHLGLQPKDIEEKKEKILVEFLGSIIPGARELFILGDLFDYWFEYRSVIQKGYYQTFTALKHLSDRGVKIHYIIGNHDFLHVSFFNKEFNAQLYRENFSIEIEGKKFYLGHGDGLVKNDVGYLILKKILRNKITQWIYSIIHPDLGIKLASSTSKKSRDYTQSKSYGEIDGVAEAAKKKIDEGYDYVIFGHTHQSAFEKYKDGYYINFGSWLSQPCYGKFTDNKFEIINL